MLLIFKWGGDDDDDDEDDEDDEDDDEGAEEDDSDGITPAFLNSMIKSGGFKKRPMPAADDGDDDGPRVKVLKSNKSEGVAGGHKTGKQQQQQPQSQKGKKAQGKK